MQDDFGAEVLHSDFLQQAVAQLGNGFFTNKRV